MTLKEIAEASGGSVSEEWLKKFVQKKDNGNWRVRNPGVNSVQALHDFLTRKSKAS